MDNYRIDDAEFWAIGPKVLGDHRPKPPITPRKYPYVYHCLIWRTSADRQRTVFKATGDLNALVDHLIEETEEGMT